MQISGAPNSAYSASYNPSTGLYSSGSSGSLLGLLDPLTGQKTAIEQANINAIEAAKGRDFSSVEAQKVRDENRYLRSTAYQVAVDDMKKAGLNPALLYSSGAGGASTPTSPTAYSVSGRAGGTGVNMINGLISTVASVLTKGISSAFQAAMASKTETTQSFSRDGELLGSKVRYYSK